MRLTLTAFALLLALIAATPADACHKGDGAGRSRLGVRRATTRPVARVVQRTTVRVGTACPNGACPAR